MAGIDEVLERLVADGDFRAALARDPAAALAGYDLTRDDVELLASRLDDDDDAERTVEQRTSKSAMLALLASFAGPGGGGAADSGHEDQIEVLSWSWGETQGDDAVPDDLAVPDDAADELYNKSQGKVEEGVKAELDPDALTGPGTTEASEYEFNYGKIQFEAEPLDPALADVGDEPEEATEVFVKIGDIKGEAPDPAGSPGDDPMDLGGVKAEVDSGETTPGAPSTDDEGIIVIDTLEDDGTAETENVEFTYGKVEFEGEPLDPGSGGVAIIPPDGGAEGTTPPDDGLVSGNPPDDSLVGSNPPDDGLVGANPPDDNLVGANPPDDSLEGVTPPGDGVVGANPPDDNLGARTDVAPAMDADDVMEIEDV